MERWVVDNEISAQFTVWTRGNVGEVFPEVVSPMTWSVAGKDADSGWRDALIDAGAVVAADFDSDRPCLVGVFGGYAYLGVTGTRLFAHRTPLVKVADIDRGLFGEQDAPPWDPTPFQRRIGCSLKALRTLLQIAGTKSPPAVVATEGAAVDAWVRSLPPVESESDEALIERLRTFGPRFRELFRTHIAISFRATIAAALVGQLVGGDEKVPALIAGIGDIESAGPSRALWSLGRLAPGAEFDRAFADFIRDFGYRGPNEWDFAATTWDNNPAGAMAAIESLRKADASHDPDAQRTRLAADRAAATAAARAALRPWNRGRFDKALRAAILFAQSREATKSTVIRAIHAMRVAARELARRGAERGGPGDATLFFLLALDEVPAYLADPASFAETLDRRAAARAELMALVPPFVFDTVQPPPETWERRETEHTTVTAGTTLHGIGACPGVAKGRARVVMDPFDPRGLGPGDVLVAPITDPSWTPLFLPAEAVVVDVGAAMSHAVIVSRELGIPAVVSVTGATAVIPDGALIEVDGTAGTVRVLDA